VSFATNFLEAAGFDVLVTTDKNLDHYQAVVQLEDNKVYWLSRAGGQLSWGAS
jgi:hypothetical protein